MVLVIVALVIILSVRFFTYYSQLALLQNGEKVNLATRLTDEPAIKNGRQQFRIKTKDGQKINITTGLSTLYKYGDRVRISGSVKSNEYNGYTFFTMNFHAS